MRKNVRVSELLQNLDIGLIPGRIAHADEMYFNGKLIGKTGGFPPDSFSMWNLPRHYLIPSPLIDYGRDNVLAIRISCFLYGGISDTIITLGYDEWLRERRIGNFFAITIPHTVIGVGIFLLLMFILFYASRPSENEYLLFCLQLLCGFFIVFDLCCTLKLPISDLARFKIVGISWVALNVFHPLFLHRLYNLNRHRVETFLILYGIFMSAFALISCENSIRTTGLVLIPFTTAIGLYNISCHVSAILKQRPMSFFFGIFGIKTIAGSIHDGLVLSRFLDHPNAVLGYRFDTWCST
jgi:hypothetical protein